MSNFNITNNRIENLIAGDNNKVNFGKPKRHLDDSLKTELNNNISSSDTIVVTAVLGDQEAFAFASEIKDYLSDKGYTVDGVNQAIYTKPVVGQIFDRKKETSQVNLIIGSQEWR